MDGESIPVCPKDLYVEKRPQWNICVTCSQGTAVSCPFQRSGLCVKHILAVCTSTVTFMLSAISLDIGEVGRIPKSDLVMNEP